MSNPIEIKIDKNYLGLGNMYRMEKINIYPGLNIIAGCNGIGKSTILAQIRDQFMNKIPMFVYSNLTDGGSRIAGEGIMYGDLSTAATMITSSEGEGIIVSLNKIFGKIWHMVRAAINKKNFIILLDGIDSGTSIDASINIRTHLIKIAESSEKQGRNLYFVVAVNDFEFLRGQKVIDALSGKEMVFDDYETYKKYILKSAKSKDSRNTRWDRNARNREAKRNKQLEFHREID